MIEVKNGLFLEFGVWKGNTINHIASRIADDIYGFDSFEGLPENWRDGLNKNLFSVDKLPTVKNNVTLIKDWFNKTLPEFFENIKKI